MASNSQSSNMSNTESPSVKKRKIEILTQDEIDEIFPNLSTLLAQRTPTPSIQSSPNAGISSAPTPTEPMPALLQQICLTRSQLEMLESSCTKFEDFKNLVQGCFVRIMFWGHYLAESIHDVEESMQIENKIRVGRRIFLPKLGYYEFKQVNGVPPTENEILSWMNRHKSQLPSAEFVRAKIAELQEAFNSTDTTPILTRPTNTNSQKDNGNGIANLVHTQAMLIRILLPSQEFLDFLNLRGKFPERVNMVNGCLVAYKIRDDPNGRVYVSRILSIIHDGSMHFKHRPIVKIDQLLPVVEKEAIDEDAFGTWLEEMDNWNEQLPNMSNECEKRNFAFDTIRRTLQQGPPIESENRPIGWQDLVVRPEDIGVLLSGLDQQEFREVLSGMFVVFDFGNVYCSGIKIYSLSGDRAFTMRNKWALPVADVTFEPNVSQFSLPFLPPHLRSNAFLHIDPQLLIQSQISTNRITGFPIPQNRELIKRNYPWCRLNEIKYNPPSQDFVKSKMQQFWQALEKAKRASLNPHQAIVLPVPKLPAQGSTQIPVIQL